MVFRSTLLACGLSALAGANALVSVDLATAQPEAAFKQWLTEYGKDYADNESVFSSRLEAFQANAQHIIAARALHPHATFELNEYADLTVPEFQAKLGVKPELEQATPNLLSTFRYSDTEHKKSVDWTAEGVVTGVKDQGQCGSCWAFSTIGSIEGANALATGKLVSLSEQELVDCDRAEDQGCNGGLMNNAFEFVIANKGVDTEADYTYWGAFSFCNRRKESDRTVVEITGYEKVPQRDEDALAKAVSGQPVAVAICADRSLMLYKGGILSDGCTGLNHGVLLVGYGEDAGVPYWKVKNSWGGAWGEEGFFRLKKDVGGEGTCGITMMASYPVKDDSSNLPVPTICDAQLFSLYECPPKSTCNCSFNLFGLVCLTYDCVPKTATACAGTDDLFCSESAPVCDTEVRVCRSEDGEYTAEMSERTLATKREVAAPPRIGASVLRVV